MGQHTVDDWRVQRGALGLPELPYPETRFFVRRVLLARERYQVLYPELRLSGPEVVLARARSGG